MGDGDDCAGELRDHVPQDLALVGVEVRLGLVEEEEIRVADQAGGERGELALSAGERGGRKRQVVVVEAQADEQAPRFSCQPRSTGFHPAIEHRLLFDEDAIHLREVGRDRGPRQLRLDRPELVVERGDVRPPGEHPRLRRPVVALGVLLEVAHGDSAPPDDLALVHVLGATDDPEHRRLAGTVRSDDPDPGAVGHHEVDPLEHGPRAVRLVHPDEADDGHLSDEAYGTARPPPRTPRAARGAGRRPRSNLRSRRAPEDPPGAAGLAPTTHGSRRRTRAIRLRGPDAARRASAPAQPTSRCSSSRIPSASGVPADRVEGTVPVIASFAASTCSTTARKLARAASSSGESRFRRNT